MSILRNKLKTILNYAIYNSRTITSFGHGTNCGINKILNVQKVNPVNISKRFAGHSKWQNIRHIKAAKDAEKSAISNKYSKMIRQAVRDGNQPDPKLNFKLAQLIEQARSKNVTTSCIESAIKGASTSKESLEPALFEIKGPGGCFLVVEALTDNLQRTKHAIKAVLNKTRCSMAERSSRHFFTYKGVINVEKTEKSELDKALDDAIIAGAEDVHETTSDDGKDILQFLAEPKEFFTIKKKLQEMKYEIHSSGLQYVPMIKQKLSDDDLNKTDQLYDLLENSPDVVRIYDNIE